jgi:glycosyltransferase involved in cell wall biosynthesis
VNGSIQGRAVILRSNPVAPDPRVEKLAKTLVKNDWRVMTLAWDRTGQMGKFEEDPSTGSLYRLRLKARFGSGIKNLPALLIWQVYLLFSLLSHHRRYDVIHACDFDTVLPALLVGKLMGKPVVFDIFDLYADSVRATPKPILKIISQMETLAINRAAAVILADDSRKQQIAGSRPKKLIVVYNSPAEDVPTPSEHISGEGFRLVYVGLLVRERGLAEVIEIVRRHPDWQFALAGFGGDEEEILERARDCANIRWHGRVDYRTALGLTAAADAVFAIYDPAVPNHRYSSPNKVFEAMMLGKPLVVARGTNMDKLVEANECGLLVDYGQVEQIERVFGALAGDPGLRRRLGANGTTAYKERYSWEIMSQRITRLYSEL